MVRPGVIGADCEAFGHPTDCTEPAPGSVQKDSPHNITVDATGGTAEVATLNTSTMHFPSHAHSVQDGSCTDDQSHDIDPDGEPSITVNGSPIYVIEDSVATDPESDGDVDIVSNPFATGMNILI